MLHVPGHFLMTDLSARELWRIATGDECWGFDVTADGRVAAGCHDGAVYLADAQGNLLWQIDVGEMNREVEFSPDGAQLFTGPYKGEDAALLDAASGAAVWTYREPRQWLRNSRWSPDGQRIVAGFGFGQLTALTREGAPLWEVAIGQFPTALEVDSAYNVYAAGKNRELFSFDADGNLRWRRRIPDHVVTAGDMSADGDLIVLGTVGNWLYAFDAMGELLWRRHLFGIGVGNNGVDVTPDGTWILTGSALYDRDGTLIWRLETGPESPGANTVTISDDGRYIAAGYEDSVIRIFERVETAQAHRDAPIGQSSDDSIVLAGGSPMRFNRGTNGDSSVRIAPRIRRAPAGITGTYILAFHTCDTATSDCRDPRNHRVYLAQSDDGASWSLVPGWEPYQGSVPDVIRRGDSLYIYTPNQVRRYRFSTGTWEEPVQVTLTDPEATGGYVDPSLFVDDQGRLVLFYLLGIIGQDPAGCGPGQTMCVKHFHSATEVEGSDGTAFVAEPGDRVQVTINSPGSASDPDIFYDGARYVLYISRGPSVQVYTSPTLHGNYTLLDDLPGGYLTHAGGVPSGHFDPSTSRYWTYVHTNQGIIRRAVHKSLDTPLSDSDFVTVLSGNSVGLGTSYRVESPGFAVNTTAGTTASALVKRTIVSATTIY